MTTGFDEKYADIGQVRVLVGIRRLWMVASVMMLAACVSLSIEAQEGRQPGESYALLVGCTRYPSLEEKRQLNGPGNDVMLFRELLLRKFHFPSDAIVTLAENLGNDLLRPTRANIVQEFERLIDVVKPGDQVVILLAGHGSQQPDNDPEDEEDDELDGLDETFLPCDIGGWDKDKSIVTNAIVDDEIRAWLASIRNAGAFVFFVADSCHSGTLTRGNGSEVTRHIDAAELIPKNVLELARHTATKQRAKSSGREQGDRIDLPKDRGGIVALYAAQPDEEEPEMLLPRQADEQKWYGLLTHTISEVLMQSTSPITYRELSSLVHQRYIQIGRLNYPTPLLEGTNLEREILGQKDWPERPQYALSRNRIGVLSLNAGSLHGFTKGSILAVFPPSGASDADRSLGHVRVVAVRSLECQVVPCKFGDAPEPVNLPDGGRVQLAYQDFGDLRLHVAVDGQDTINNPVTKELHERLTKSLMELSKNKGSLVFFEEDASKADWLVRAGGDDIFLIPASGHAPARSRSMEAKGDAPIEVPSPLYGPGKIDKNLSFWLHSQFHRIAKVSNLKRIVGNDGVNAGKVGDGVSVDVEVERVANDGAEPTPVATDTGVRVLNEGDIVRLRVHNSGTVPFDVTLLFVDADFGIKAILPRAGTTDTNRVDPGKSLSSLKLQITAASDLEHIVAIAVRSEPQRPRLEFTCLEQDSLERARSGSRGGNDPLDSPFGKLLQYAIFAEGQTRGAPFAEVDRHALRRISWRVDPPKHEN